MKSKAGHEKAYYVVIFSSKRTQADEQGYEEMAEKMLALAQTQEGFLGVESVRGSDGFGITVSYWESPEAIRAWKAHTDHLLAQKLGRTKWYESFTTRICKVEREYGFET